MRRLRRLLRFLQPSAPRLDNVPPTRAADAPAKLIDAIQRVAGPLIKPGADLWTGPTDRELIGRALRIAACTRNGALPFYLDLYRETSFVPYKDLVRAGPAISREEKAAVGAKTRAIVGRDFFDTLDAVARRFPIDAAVRIANAINVGMRARERLAIVEAVEPGGLVDLIRSTGPAGPCRAVCETPATARARAASLLPLVDCSHPEQCFCMYAAKLDHT